MSRVKRLWSLRPTVSVRLMPRYHMVTPISPAFVIQSRKFANVDPIPPTNSPSNDAKTATKTRTQGGHPNDAHQTVWDRAWSRFQTASVFVTDNKDILKFIAGIGAFFIGLWKFDHHFSKVEDKADDMPRVALESEQEFQDTQREKLFEIAKPQVPRHKLERATKANAWKNFIYANLLNSPSIYWIYGAKRVGKSTMLQQYTYALQTELGAGKIEDVKQYDWADDLKATNFRVFYINLEKRGEDEMDTRQYVRDLVHQIRANEKDGKMSLVVVDSIGAMFGDAELTEDMTFAKYKEATDKVENFVPNWTVGFFRFVKSMYDSNTASFLFMTSKPMHYAVRLPLIKHYMFGNVIDIDIDSEAAKQLNLSLHLSNDDIVTYLKSNAPSLTDKEYETLRNELKQMETAELKMNRVGHLEKMIKRLAFEPKWQGKFEVEQQNATKHKWFGLRK